MGNTLQVDGLAHILGYNKHYTCRILSHQIESVHALFDVLVLDRGTGKTTNDLVDRNCELPANLTKLNKTKLPTDKYPRIETDTETARIADCPPTEQN